MKYLWRFALLALVILGFSGCASTGTTASGDPVPGEKKDEDSRLQPGASSTGPNASVKW
jgi:hypothetical protein